MSTTDVTQPIVVGIDESEHSLRAAEWAAVRAVARHRPLRLVHAASPDLYAYREVPEPLQNLVHQGLVRARAAAPGVDVSGEVVVRAAAPMLLEESRDATMVVVGNRGHGGFAGLFLGSVGVQVSSHAHCPVVVVRPQEPHSEQWDAPAAGQVVVGVDGSPHADDALGFAFEEAAQRGVALAAVHAWTGPVLVGPGDMLPLVYDLEEVSNDERRVLAEAVAGWREKYPAVAVRRLVVHGEPAKQLVRFSHEAELLVVGARGLGGFAGLVLGSVSQAALHHATCPVAVVRPALGRSSVSHGPVPGEPGQRRGGR